jgi:DNA invertase Pin-like site-specific DNA recombinase
MLIGYARVSSTGQSLDLQREALAAAGCEEAFEEKRSGRTAADRPELQRALQMLRKGDTLVITRLDRLARSVSDLHQLVERVTAKGASLRVLQQSGVDTGTSTGKLMLAILAAVAEFENDIRRERQRDGIEAAKERGVYKGRPREIDPAKVRALKASGIGPAEIARQMGIGRATVYRALSAAE